MREISKAELIGYCESRAENDEKVDVLKIQIKALNSDSSDLTKETAKDFETSPKHLNSVYKKYKDYQKGDTDDDDFYSMASLLQEALDEENTDGDE